MDYRPKSQPEGSGAWRAPGAHRGGRTARRPALAPEFFHVYWEAFVPFEVVPTIEKRFAALGIENTAENRRRYRQMLFTTRGAAEFISGVILFDETIRQKADDGTPFPEVLARQGIVPFSEMIEPTTGRVRIRYVDIRSEANQTLYAYMIRLKPEDFERPDQLGALARSGNLSEPEFTRRFGYLVGKTQP